MKYSLQYINDIQKELQKYEDWNNQPDDKYFEDILRDDSLLQVCYQTFKRDELIYLFLLSVIYYLQTSYQNYILKYIEEHNKENYDIIIQVLPTIEYNSIVELRSNLKQYLIQNYNILNNSINSFIFKF